jgi:hypothetical protein
MILQLLGAELMGHGCGLLAFGLLVHLLILGSCWRRDHSKVLTQDRRGWTWDSHGFLAICMVPYDEISFFYLSFFLFSP